MLEPRELTREELLWAKRLQRVLKDMPEALEIIVSKGTVHVMEHGWYMREIWDAGTDMLCHGGGLIERDALHRIDADRQRVLANSESV